MNNNTNTKTRNAIVSAINNLIESNSKNNPYDKTFIGRITDNTNGSKNLYNVSINGKIYENIKGLPLFNFKNNSIVYCIAPQGNMNLLRIVVSLDKNIDIILKDIYANDINADIINVGSSQLTDGTGLLNLANANGMKINSNDVDTIVSKSLTTNGYIKYSSGLIIQWGIFTPSGTNADTDQQSNFCTFPISFAECFQITATCSGNNLGAGYNNSIMISTIQTNGFYIRKNFSETDRQVRYITIGK